MKWLHKVIFSVLPNCREAEQMQSRHLDEPLGFGDRMRVRMHNLMCRYCRRFGRQIALLRRLCGELPESETFRSEPLPETSRRRIEAALTSELDPGEK